MQGGLRQLPCCRVPRPAACGLAAPAQRPVRSRGALQVVAFGKFFDNLKKGAGGGDKGQDSGEAARKALQARAESHSKPSLQQAPRQTVQLRAESKHADKRT